MSDVIVWLIIAVFYAPLHFLGPVGVIILTMPSTQYRRRLMRYVLAECSISMLLGFAFAIWLVIDNLKIAMLILFISMLLPYFLLLLHRQVIDRID